MATVTVSFTPVTAHVRTARLVALAVARRAGVGEEMLDEVRLAVGEACSRAVGIHSHLAVEQPVVMKLSDDRDRFSIEVLDRGTLDEGPAGLAGIDLAEVSSRALDDDLPDAMPSGFGLAVISGLVENLDVAGDATSTRVTMTWPTADRRRPI